MDYDFYFKFILVGEAGVGKSCLLNRFIDNNFIYNQTLTIGIETKNKIINVNGNKVKLNIWDTAGSEQYKGITRSYYRAAIGVIITYDITRIDSFKKTIYWLNECLENGNKDLQIILVGNKCDLNNHRLVSKSEAEIFSKKHNIYFMEGSAKDAINIEEIFKFLSNKIIEKIQNGIISIKREDLGIKLGKSQKQYLKKDINNQESSNCCEF